MYPDLRTCIQISSLPKLGVIKPYRVRTDEITLDLLVLQAGNDFGANEKKRKTG